MSNKLSIVNTGKKYSFKDKDDLKEKIYELSLGNIDEAKKLYGLLIPPDPDMNIVISNSEQAVNCLRVVREQSESLVKLFGEINRAEKDLGDKSKEIGVSAIYLALDQLEAEDKLKNDTMGVLDKNISNGDTKIKEQGDLDNLYDEDNKP